MKLDLEVSKKMSQRGENELIRLSSSDIKRLNTKLGNYLKLTTSNKTNIRVKVEEIYLEDISKNKKVSYVSQETFDILTGSKKFEGVTLGCDPEFVFLNQKRRVFPASYWLPAKGPIGSDGPLAELRPDPAEHEEEVVENLRKLIHILPFLGSKEIVAEAHSCWQNYAIGFHIHLGAPKELTTLSAPRAREFVKSFITVLDYFVGIPAMLLEDSNIRRLGNGIYGKPGDYRVSTKTIEYRTPGGYHLRHPKYAAGIMGLALCTAKEVLTWTEEKSSAWKNLGRYSEFKHLKKKFNLPDKKEIVWVLSDPSKKSSLTHIPNMISQLQQMGGFKDHQDSISSYFGLVLDNKQFSPNLAKSWK